MSKLHRLKSNTKRQSIKRVGRGGKRGTTSGKGQKGQKSRAGHRIRPASRDLLIRIPKLRGFKNKPLRDKTIAVNLDKIEAKVEGSVVNLESLFKAGLIRKSEKRVKILGTGKLSRPLEFAELLVSKTAVEKIKEAGGKITNN